MKPGTSGFYLAKPEDFVRYRGLVPKERQHFLTPYTADDIRDLGGEPYLWLGWNDGSAAGFLLIEHFAVDDLEIANLFRVGLPPGAGEMGLIKAISLGGNLVEWFDEPHLNELYAFYGFKEIARFPFDAAVLRNDHPYADLDAIGEPDYIVARRTDV